MMFDSTREMLLHVASITDEELVAFESTCRLGLPGFGLVANPLVRFPNVHLFVSVETLGFSVNFTLCNTALTLAGLCYEGDALRAGFCQTCLVLGYHKIAKQSLSARCTRQEVPAK